MQAANRVVMNTGLLYGKMLVTIFISLYSTRLVLSALGALDYGIFNLIAGVIAMLSFLNMAMTLSTQRYMSYNLGGGDMEKLKKVFNASILLHLLLGLGLVLLFEAAGYFLFGHVLNIPPDRVPAARTIYHFMVASAFVTIISVPYDATINARENMLLVALTGIAEALLKLAVALALQRASADRLILFSGLSAASAIALLLFKRVYCSVKYPESRIKIGRYKDKALLKEMFSYGGWNMFGAVSVVTRNQGIAMILNVFFGTIVNAAYGIANQVNAQLSFFSVTLMQALNPQIMKSEGQGNRERMLKLAMIASKFSFALLAFFAIPLLLETPFVLGLWLKEVPAYTVVFCRLILLCTMVNQLSVGIQVGVQSVGKIRKYQVAVSLLLMLNLPVAYVLLRMGLPAWSVLASALGIEIMTCAYRVKAAEKLIGLPVKTFLRGVVLRAVGSVLLAFCIALLPYRMMDEGWARLIATGAASTAGLACTLHWLGLSAYETGKIRDVMTKALTRIHPRLAVIKKAA
ncbi:lipopolysaccharide biosynthesis protein [Chitinophaga sp. NPDC101104]|uniref:lipopolysaccharide biosynthesis protein n=1 Tax=Chitinophaga sp. NPDC101104 TaxID=3390561 RepID=UPI003D030DE8